MEKQVLDCPEYDGECDMKIGAHQCAKRHDCLGKDRKYGCPGIDYTEE